MGRLWMREGDFLVQIAMVTVGVAMVLGECFTDAVFSPADTRDPLYWEFTVTAATASCMSLGRHLFTQCACLWELNAVRQGKPI